MNEPRPSRTAPHRGGTVHSIWANSVMENFYEAPAQDRTQLGVWCYADQLSYVAGDTINIHTCVTTKSYSLSMYRDGVRKTRVFEKTDLTGNFYDTPDDCSVNGCGWPVAIQIKVPSEWKSGGYVLHISAAEERGQVEHHFPVIIRSAKPSTPDAILMIAATGTWVAYNEWGGSNFYEGIRGVNHDYWSPVVSTLRPFSRGFAWLPEGAPRVTPARPPKMGDAIRYPHMEWAYANGFSKKYASAGWATYDRHFFRWAEKEGYTVDVATQHDLHANQDLLKDYKCVVIVGHDEYWSWEMREAIDHYVEAGGNVARFGGNFGWQIRIEDDGKRQICYKADAEFHDPIRNTDRKHLTSGAWDDRIVDRPGALTFGLNSSGGCYASWGGCVPRGSGGFSVYRPDHWAFEGTDLYYGDQLGADSKIFGYEVDGCDYEIRNGLPFATGSDGAPKDMEIIALGLATNLEADHGNPGSTFFMGSVDAHGLAYKLLRRTDAEAIDRVARGSGMIICWNRGAGCILNAASCEWVAGLIANDPFVDRFTRNVLNRFLKITQSSTNLT